MNHLFTNARSFPPTDYCFGGNRDRGDARCTGLDESCVETCAGCCAGFGSGVWTGLSAREEDESRAILCLGNLFLDASELIVVGSGLLL